MTEWRYLHERSRVKHALTRSTDAYSICGSGHSWWAHSPEWRGTGSQSEYDRAAELPECRRCNRILKGRHVTTRTYDLAKIAYQAYGDAAEWKNFAGQPMPAWGDLGDGIRTSWQAATEAVRQRIADDIAAYEPKAHPVVCAPEIAYKAAQERMEAVARNS